MNLYELTGEYLELLQMAEDGEFDQETIADTLEGLGGEIEAKADGYGKIIKSLEGEIAGVDGYIDGLKAEIERLNDKKKSLDRNIVTLKESLKKAMIATDKRNIKTSLFTFYVSKRSSVEILEDIVPSQFKVAQEPKIDKKAINEYIKEHGNMAWATIKETESLGMR